MNDDPGPWECPKETLSCACPPEGSDAYGDPGCICENCFNGTSYRSRGIMKTEKIYLASSWRNVHQPEMITLLRGKGYEVYDFRNPQSGGPPTKPESGFSWKHVDPDFTPNRHDALERFRKMLAHPLSQDGFESDFNAMKWADTCVIALPSGRSAHLEAGWMSGAGKKLVVYMPPTLGKCQGCFGSKTQSMETTEGRHTYQCVKCAGTGKDLLWNFEPELMYMIGGGPDVLCFTHDEMLARLAA